MPTPSEVDIADDEEVVTLSPFTVEASEDEGSYRATATLASTRIRTDLKDIGSAISVVTAQFLQDTAATNSQTLLTYTTNTEVAGLGGNFAGLGDTKTLDDTTQRMAPHQSTRVRGLSQADNTRDFFLTDIPWDSFNVGRVDLQRGANSMLFGTGRPAGIINSSTNAASFANSGTIETRFGSYGSFRSSLDFNKALLPDELAMRVAMLHDKTNYQQRPAYNRDYRLYVAGRWDPKFIRFEGARTSLRFNYEEGDIDANRPRILPPGDLITPWWTRSDLAAIRLAGGMDVTTLGLSDGPTIAALRAAGDLGAGVRGDNSTYYNRAIGAFGRNYGGIVARFDNPASGNHVLMTTDIPKNVTSVVTSLPWTIMSGVNARKDLEGSLQTLENYDFYRDEVLMDRGIFDFYNKLLDGPNKAEWSNHHAFNVALSQTFLDNRIGIEAVYDRQSYDRGQVNLMSEFGQAITIDLNNTLVDGSANPNYGKACLISDQYANYSYASERESYRFNVFTELRFDGDSFLKKLLGYHRFNAVASRDDVDIETRSWRRYAADLSYGLDILDDPGLRNRTVNTLNYLTTSSIAGLANINTANIGNLTAVQIPLAGSIRSFDMTWTAAGVSPTDPWTDQYGNVVTQAANPANYAGWDGADRAIDLISDAEGDRDLLTTDATLQATETKTLAANWQGYFFDGVLVPTVGVRSDEQTAWALLQSDLPKRSDGSDTVDLSSPNYRLPDDPIQTVKKSTTSWSVVLHTPQKIRDKLPGRTGLSLFYNSSGNFQPAAGRIDVMGNPLSSPEGKSKDWGFMLSTFDDRLYLKVTWYDSKTLNDELSTFGGAYMIWGAEAWAYCFGRGNLLRANVGGWADFRNGYDPLGIVASETPEGGWTETQIAYAQAVGDAICEAYFDTRPSDAWFALWGIDIASGDQGNFIWGTQPSGFTITGDTRSKGTEFEIVAEPTKGWNISVNASKTTAQRLNMAGSMVDFIEQRWATYNTPVTLNGQQVGVIGDVRFWNGGYNPGETLRGKFSREFMSGYYLYRIQENSDVPELRPWRFNAVTNYTFSSGPFKGLNIGGAFRWQDGVVTGYPVLPGATTDDPRAFDLDNPYKGPSESNIDLWAGYQHRLSDKINWRIQLNVRNAFASDDLIPITVQPDGSVATARIPEGTTWWLSNKIEF